MAGEIAVLPQLDSLPAEMAIEVPHEPPPASAEKKMAIDAAMVESAESQFVAGFFALYTGGVLLQEIAAEQLRSADEDEEEETDDRRPPTEE
ncbi:MAG: hypothetical protein NZ700_04130 [Gemmataceae bacterium]|nr:hypothetical protein [Gemmataceae bacterium]MDW8266985.1 hypothetical protein [Gemmataceae bacterium]